MSRLRAVGLYHDLDLKDHQQEFSAPYEPLPPVEQVTHTPNTEKLTQNYNLQKPYFINLHQDIAQTP